MKSFESILTSELRRSNTNEKREPLTPNRPGIPAIITPDGKSATLTLCISLQRGLFRQLPLNTHTHTPIYKVCRAGTTPTATSSRLLAESSPSHCLHRSISHTRGRDPKGAVSRDLACSVSSFNSTRHSLGPLNLHAASYRKSTAMHQQTLLATLAASLAALPFAQAGFYSKNSPVLQVDAKSYDRLITKSNHTSVSLSSHSHPQHPSNISYTYTSVHTTPRHIIQSFKHTHTHIHQPQKDKPCTNNTPRSSNSTPPGAATAKTSSPPTKKPPAASTASPRSPLSTATPTPTSPSAAPSASRASPPSRSSARGRSPAAAPSSRTTRASAPRAPSSTPSRPRSTTTSSS